MSKSRLSDAVWTAFTEALRFIVVPLVLVDLVTSNYPQLATAFMPQIEVFVLFFGGMIVASSTLEAMHRPGTYKRLLFGMVAIAFVGVWLYILFGGGVAEFTYGPYFVRFDITKIVYIVLGGVALKGLLVYTTFSANRRAEAQRAERAKAEEAERIRSRTAKARRAQVSKHPPSPSFDSLSSTAFEVTADEAVGYTSGPYSKEVPVGMKVCEVCGAQSKTKDYVCRNCGSWFPTDSVI